MRDITKADKNFVVKTKIEKDNICFYDAETQPFTIYGVFREGEKFRRIPQSVAKNTNEGVLLLHANTAGGRVRFITNSRYIAINVQMDGLGKMPHFAFTGSIGFDLYVKERGREVYFGTFVPPVEISDCYESVKNFPNRKMREVTINFPLYSDVKKLYIGLEKNAVIKEANPYKNEKPIVYYGSSITQGGCASRPGNSYQAIISRKLDRDYINLGFAGSARAEKAIYEYIKKLDMEIFVYDYDHNAPSVEHLLKTHEKMFLEIRKEKPDLPVIMMSRPVLHPSEEEKKRLEIIKATYNNAIERGDKNVYLLDGKKLMKNTLNDGTVDGCHPNDFGFHSMAKALVSLIEKILNKK